MSEIIKLKKENLQLKLQIRQLEQQLEKFQKSFVKSSDNSMFLYCFKFIMKNTKTHFKNSYILKLLDLIESYTISLYNYSETAFIGVVVGIFYLISLIASKTFIFIELYMLGIAFFEYYLELTNNQKACDAKKKKNMYIMMLWIGVQLFFMIGTDIIFAPFRLVMSLLSNLFNSITNIPGIGLIIKLILIPFYYLYKLLMLILSVIKPTTLFNFIELLALWVFFIVRNYPFIDVVGDDDINIDNFKELFKLFNNKRKSLYED